MSEQLWTLYACSDCDPEFVDPEVGDEVYGAPYELLIPAGEPAPDICPRCEGYLGITATVGVYIVEKVVGA